MNTDFDMCQALASQCNADVVIFKDENSRYLAGSQGFLSLIGLSSIDELYGKTDYELPYATFAEQYITNDKEAMTAGSLQVFEPTVNYANETMLILAHKYPFTHPITQVSGCLGIGKIIHSFVVDKSIQLLKNYDVSQLKVSSTLLGDKINHHAKTPLTAREIDVFYYMLHGFSQKYIANKLFLSVRTIEDYVDHIKNKLGCKNKNELFELAIENDLINIMPRHLLI